MWWKKVHGGMGKSGARWMAVLAAMLLAVALLAGCGASAPSGPTGEGERQPEAGAPSETAKPGSTGFNPAKGEYGWLSNTDGQFPVTLIDGTGQEVTIEKKPEKIVSLQASHTEISFALGLGEHIVGVSDFCNYPEEALTKEKVGGRNMDAEKILSMLPDLALVTDYHYNNHKDILEQFKQVGINVVVINSATSFEHAYTTMHLIGGATGATAKAGDIISDMQQRLEAVKQKAQAVKDKAKVWVEVSPSPDIFTTGTGTFMHEMLEAINAENAAAHMEGWTKVTEEEIVVLMPDVIVTTYGYYVDNPEEGVYKRAGWAEVPAVKNKRVYDVDSDTVTRPGPRLIDGVELLGEIIYPDIFK